MISASPVREALAVLGWTSAMLAKSALVTLDEAVAAQDDVAIQGLDGLQLGLIRAALEAADAETLSKDRGISVRLR